ncbi:MAG: NAD(P)-binding domain-containing protein [Saprospiraceae bacterium]|nr:NAD(P)-binding domain-containing protein [Saprospiraceae bacterium]
MTTTTPSSSVCVIGAGCSGIAAIKNLIQAGITDIVCYEQNERIGGNWLYSEKEGHSSICETTHIISSKSLSEYLDFPMPEHYPAYPSHEQLLQYFEDYAAHFGLHAYIRFNTRVKSVQKGADDRWKVMLEDGQENWFDFLFVANGHHNVPRHPELSGTFTGEYLHAHAYKVNTPFRNKRILVIGGGNSACDCAVEISRVARSVAISMRSAQYIVPKFFLGQPTDTFNQGLLWLPESLAALLRRIGLYLQIGRYERYGLLNPKFPVTKAHPTVNSELLYKIGHGKVHPRRGIQRIDGKDVYFEDGKKETYDVIIAATGYKIALPFFAPDFINYEEAERVPLYLRMFHARHPTLVFIGLFQPQGAIWPLSDYQSKLAANYVARRWKLPANLKMLAEKDAEYIAKAFLPSKRHSIEVHYHQFLKNLKSQIPVAAPDWKVVSVPQKENVS